MYRNRKLDGRDSSLNVLQQLVQSRSLHLHGSPMLKILYYAGQINETLKERLEWSILTQSIQNLFR